MTELSFIVGAGGTSQSVAISSTSAQSAAIPGNMAMIYATADCFMRCGANPTAVSDGTDQFVPASTMLRVQLQGGGKLAFKTTGATGSVYITPGA